MVSTYWVIAVDTPTDVATLYLNHFNQSYIAVCVLKKDVLQHNQIMIVTKCVK